MKNINDPDRIWNIPANWESFPLNREYWNHREIMALRGRMLVISKRKPSVHADFQFATEFSVGRRGPFLFQPSDRLTTADDVKPWPIQWPDNFSDDEISKAEEFIQMG